VTLLLLFGGAGSPAVVTPIPIYNFQTLGGSGGYVTLGGANSFASIGGKISIGTSGGAPSLSTLGGTPNIGTGAGLLWAAPTLSSPTVFSPNNSGFSGRFLNAAGADVLVQMPAFVLNNQPGSTGCLRIDNAHNIVIVGGQMDAPTSGGNEAQRQAMVFVGCTGTIHVEGVLAGSDSTYITDGIDVYTSPLATLQVQNCEFWSRATDEVNFTDSHPDAIFLDNVQNSGLSLGTLRVDRCKFNTDYQGITMVGSGCTAYISRTQITVVEKGQAATSQAFWQHDATDPVTFGADVWLQKRASQTYGLSVHPDSSDGTIARRPTVSAGNVITWPTEPTITGQINGGTAPADFVAATRGIGYVTP
jgi:hypothetical protein